MGSTPISDTRLLNFSVAGNSYVALRINMSFVSAPYMGEGYTPAYQLSGIPWVTSSVVALGEIQEHTFPHVTRFFTVMNKTSGSIIAVGFTRNGLLPVSGNFFYLSGSEQTTTELKVDRLFISGAAGASEYSLLAGLTSIPRRNFGVVTASAGYEGVG